MRCNNFNEAWEGLEQFIDNLDMDDLDIGHDEGMFLVALIQDEMSHSKANVEYNSQEGE